MIDLAKIALALPDVEQGIACAGTALESRTFRAGSKAFLFVSPKDARLKLDESAAEARELGFAIGANGWATLPLTKLPPAAVAKRWIAESHALVARPAAKKSPPKAGARKKPAAKRKRGA